MQELLGLYTANLSVHPSIHPTDGHQTCQCSLFRLPTAVQLYVKEIPSTHPSECEVSWRRRLSIKLQQRNTVLTYQEDQVCCRQTSTCSTIVSLTTAGCLLSSASPVCLEALFSFILCTSSGVYGITPVHIYKNNSGSQFTAVNSPQTQVTTMTFDLRTIYQESNYSQTVAMCQYSKSVGSQISKHQ